MIGTKRKIELIGVDPCWTDPKQVYPTEHSTWELGSGDICIVIDHLIPQGQQIDKKKYAWVYEPTEVIKPIVHDIEKNINTYMSHYEKIFTHNKSLSILHENIIQVPPGFPSWIKDQKIHDKTKLVSMITSLKNFTKGHQKRLEWAKKLQNKIDMFGREINPIDKKEQALSDYMFSVSIENDDTELLYTEKLLDCFLCGTIPVYWGCKKITEHFNEEGIIWLTDDFDINNLNSELYNCRQEAIKDNFERAKRLNKGIPEMLDLFMEIIDE